MNDLAAMTWPEVPTGAVLAVPLGSCEQHGPHLPLDTDTRIAVALAAGLAEREPDVVVSPAVTIGASGEHQDFPGTLSIGTAALESVLVELVRSALPPPGSELPRPYVGVVLVNGHGGNVEATSRAAARLQVEGRPVLVWHPRVPGGDSHAGATETSMLLHLDPAAVRSERIEVGSTARWRELSEAVLTGGLVAVTPNGILGDPRSATARAGAEIVDHLVGELGAAVRAWRANLSGVDDRSTSEVAAADPSPSGEAR